MYRSACIIVVDDMIALQTLRRRHCRHCHACFRCFSVVFQPVSRHCFYALFCSRFSKNVRGVRCDLLAIGSFKRGSSAHPNHDAAVSRASTLGIARASMAHMSNNFWLKAVSPEPTDCVAVRAGLAVDFFLFGDVGRERDLSHKSGTLYEYSYKSTTKPVPVAQHKMLSRTYTYCK